MIGLGVMIQQLSGDRDGDIFARSVGKIIRSVSLKDDDALHFEFEDRSKIVIRDHGQLCCESRYMTTDDDLSVFTGGALVDACIKDAPSEPDEYGDHDVQFLEIVTSKGVFTMKSHNEHNGYYGGFYLKIEEA